MKFQRWRHPRGAAAAARMALILLLYLLSSAPSSAQRVSADAPGGSYNGVRLEVGWLGQKEELLIPKVHSGLICRLGYAYLSTGERVREFEVHLGYGRPATELEPGGSSYVAEFGMSYASLFPVLTRGRMQAHVGPSAGVEYLLGVYPIWDDSHSYWANRAALGARGAWTWDLGGLQFLAISLDIPFLAVYSRPEALRLYKIDDVTAAGLIKAWHGRLRGGTWDQLFGFTLDCAYLFPVGRKYREAFTYTISYLRVKDPGGEPVQNLSHSIGVRFWL